MNIKPLLRLLACALASAVLPTASALAADLGYVGTGSFGAAGSGNGELTKPADIAVADATGLIFVADSGNARVQVFAPGGSGASYLTQISGSALDTPFGLAVDQSTGDLYVADAGESRIYRFTSDGAPTPTYTVDPTFTSPKAGSADGRLGTFAVRLAVDPATGDLLVADSVGKRVSRYDSSGAFVSSFTGGDAPDGAFTGPIDLAVGAAGKMTVIDAVGDVAEGGGTSRALRFNADGTYDGAYAGVSTPGAVGIDPHTGSALLAGNVGAFSGIRLFSYDNLTLVSDVAMPGDNSGTLTGLAVDGGASENVYALGDSVFGCCGFVGVNVLSAAELPALTISASTITESSAHLQGTVDPNGRQTTWRFEISGDGGATWEPVGADADAGSGSAPVSVQGDVTGLDAHTAYQVRIIARTTEGLAATAADSFSTVVGAPRVTTLPASAVADTAATVGGSIDPRHATTSYRIDYGTTSTYGSSMPAGGGDAGTEPSTVSQRLTGLQPGATYHFRVTATNAGGTTIGSDRSFRTDAPAPAPAPGDSCPNAAIRDAQRASNLPDCRAYEQVSPVDKSGGSIWFTPGQAFGITSASPAGDALLYYSFAAFAGATSLYQNSYHAQRGPDGWTTASATPDIPENVTIFGNKGGGFGATSVDATAGLYQYSMRYGLDPLDQDDSNDVYSWREGQGVAWDSRNTDDAVDARSADTHLIGLSDNGDRRFFSTNATRFADTPGVPQAAGYQVYQRHDGQTTPVGVASDGSALSCGALIPRDPGTAAVEQSIRAISADGRTVALRSPAPSPLDSVSPPSCSDPASVLLRTPNGETIDVSASQRSTPDAPAPATFQWMSRDGERVLFTSVARLTDDAPVGGGIYQFDVDARLLTFRVASMRAAADVSLVGVSDDGQRMYFHDRPPGQRIAPEYLAFVDGSAIKHVARIIGLTLSDQAYAVATSADGKAFVFNSAERLTGYDNHAKGEVYRYDAVEDSIACVSCRADGRPPTGDSSLITTALLPPRVHNLSADGRRLFFESAEALVPGDDNGATDVYEYDHTTRRLSVLTRGTADSNYVDASVDGSTVFVITANGLLAQDSDGGGRDIYGIRTDGGFPSTASAPAPSCSGDACQPLPSSVTLSPPSASTTSSGAGNLPARAAPTAKPKVAKPAPSRSTSATLKVTVAGKGKIVATGSGLRSVSQSVAKKGTYGVHVRLSAAGVRSLAKHGRLRISTRITYRPVVGKSAATSVTVVFVKAARSVRGTTALSLDFRKGR